MDSASKHKDNPKKRKSPRKAAPAAPSRPWVLVGTYKNGQLEAWPGFYNYPLKDGDEIGEGDGRKIGELWLFRGTQDQRSFDAEFVGVKTRDELVAEYAYPAKGKPHGSRYLLFKTVEKPNRGYLHGQKVICRLRDFKMSPLWRKRLKAWLADRDGDGAEFAEFIPEAVAAVPKEALFVCETALQLLLFEGGRSSVEGEALARQVDFDFPFLQRHGHSATLASRTA